jgi:small-conductance mechanosensitive channel
MSEYLIRPIITLGGIGVLEVLGGNSLTATSALAANVAGVAVAFAIGTGLLKRALPAVLKSV